MKKQMLSGILSPKYLYSLSHTVETTWAYQFVPGQNVIANCEARGAQSTHGTSHFWHQLQTQDVAKTTLRFDHLLDGLIEPIENCYIYDCVY